MKAIPNRTYNLTLMGTAAMSINQWYLKHVPQATERRIYDAA